MRHDWILGLRRFGGGVDDVERMSFGSGGSIVVTRGIVARQAMLCAKLWGIGLADGWNVNLGGLDEGNARLPFQETWRHMKKPMT